MELQITNLCWDQKLPDEIPINLQISGIIHKVCIHFPQGFIKFGQRTLDISIQTGDLCIELIEVIRYNGVNEC